MKDQLLQLFAQYAVPLLLTGAGTGLTWLAAAVAKSYGAQAAHTLTQTALYKVEALALMVVTELEQTLRPTIQAAAADGKITPEEAKSIKDAAVDKLRSYLGADGLKKVAQVVGGDSVVSSFLNTAIEHAVSKLPASNVAVDPVAPAPAVAGNPS